MKTIGTVPCAAASTDPKIVTLPFHNDIRWTKASLTILFDRQFITVSVTSATLINFNVWIGLGFWENRMLFYAAPHIHLNKVLHKLYIVESSSHRRKLEKIKKKFRLSSFHNETGRDAMQVIERIEWLELIFVV